MGWEQRAAESRRRLVAEYWDGCSQLLRLRPGALARLGWLRPWGAWNYWWQALGLEALLDGVESGDPGAGQRARSLVAGIAHRNGGDLTANDFYDDLAWLGLAAARAHRLGLIDAEIPVALADAVHTGADPQLGGFRWRVGDDFHNVAATAPAGMLLAATWDLVDHPDRLEEARRAATWLHEQLVTPTGCVWDGCRVRAGVLVPEGPLWSYNIGTVAGLDIALARTADALEQRRLLDRAARVVRAGTSALHAGLTDVPRAELLDEVHPDAVWRDELGDGSGVDPQLFRGILARYAVELVLADPQRTADIGADVLVQAGAAWAARDGSGLIGPHWRTDPWRSAGARGGPTLAAHLSGVLTLGAAARLERAGLA